ncbi:hypothetical protein [Oscillibacter sp.]|uniref:hypothetical protein n=1 Tax=Oscillibacter sp. TaxID=1945593 RepID=UPI00289EA03C|nr:hypothetical protein [Oscillibacter sp.]
MTYRIRRVSLNNNGEITNPAKRTEIFSTTQYLHVGGLYTLRPGKLYRIEELYGG